MSWIIPNVGMVEATYQEAGVIAVAGATRVHDSALLYHYIAVPLWDLTFTGSEVVAVQNRLHYPFSKGKNAPMLLRQTAWGVLSQEAQDHTRHVLVNLLEGFRFVFCRR